MIHKRYASDFMTGKVIVATVHNTFEQVMEFFTHHKIQHLPITRDNHLIGIISIKDMLRYIDTAIADGSPVSKESLSAGFHIDQVMTPNPIAVQRTASQKDVLEILSSGKFQAVPVLDGNEVVGIITNKDITRLYHYDATHLL